MSPIPLAVGRVNRLLLNRVMRIVAPRMPGFALLTHVGRRSGVTRETPVNLFRDPDGTYRLALTYGLEAQWLKNVLAAGGCSVVARGRRIVLVRPRLVHDPEIRWAPQPVRSILRLLRVPDCVLLDPRDPEPSPRQRRDGRSRLG